MFGSAEADQRCDVNEASDQHSLLPPPSPVGSLAWLPVEGHYVVALGPLKVRTDTDGYVKAQRMLWICGDVDEGA